MRRIEKVKILRAPDVLRAQQPLLPPMGVAVITRCLRERGYVVAQDDLNAKLASPWSPYRHTLDTTHVRSLLAKRSRVAHFLRGGSDPEMHAVARKMLAVTDVAGFDAVLFSVMAADEYSSIACLLMCRVLKETTDALTVMGGEYNQRILTGDLREIAQRAGLLDYYIQGPGEEALRDLLSCMNDGGDLGRVRGLVYRDDQGLRCNDYLFGARSVVVPDLEGLPLELCRWEPDRAIERLVARVGAEKRSAPRSLTMLPFQVVAVCPNRCAFCSQSGVSPPKASILDPSAAVQQLADLQTRYDTPFFFFLDDTLNVSPSYMHRFCDAIIDAKLDIRWSDCVSAHQLDQPLLAKMRRAGAVRLVFGLETASPRLMKLIGKNSTRGAVANAIRWAHGEGIFASVEVIAGLPTETDADIEATIEFLSQNHRFLHEAYLNPFYLERNSLMFRYPSRYGIENVRPLAPSDAAGTLDENLHTYAFDEVGGLRWPAKWQQIQTSFQRVKSTADRHQLCPSEEYGMSLLFYLTTVLAKPEDVREVYVAYRARRRLRRAFSPSFLLQQLSMIRTDSGLRHSLSATGRKLIRVAGIVRDALRSFAR